MSKFCPDFDFVMIVRRALHYMILAIKIMRLMNWSISKENLEEAILVEVNTRHTFILH